MGKCGCRDAKKKRKKRQIFFKNGQFGGREATKWGWGEKNEEMSAKIGQLWAQKDKNGFRR